jgi:hypothetical protein
MVASTSTDSDQLSVGSGAEIIEDRSVSHPSNADDSSTNTPHSGSFSSTSGTTFVGNSVKNAIPDDIITSRETRAIWYSRLVVLGVLAVSATLAGVFTYLLTQDAEQTEFEVQVRHRIQSFEAIRVGLPIDYSFVCY